MESDLRGVAVGSLLVGQKKEKAFHTIYREASSDTENSASTDLYLLLALHGKQVGVCA